LFRKKKIIRPSFAVEDGLLTCDAILDRDWIHGLLFWFSTHIIIWIINVFVKVNVFQFPISFPVTKADFLDGIVYIIFHLITNLIIL
jgi:hypothetical protein